jgi:hypothetical protein
MVSVQSIASQLSSLIMECHVGPALPAPTTRSGAATTGKLIGIQGKLIGIQGKLIGMQDKRESRSLFPLLGVCFLC